MKKITCTILAIFAMSNTFAQEQTKVETPWKRGGKVSVLGSQSGFNNWQSGGTDNLSVVATVDYLINYKKEGITWDNRFYGTYGLAKMKDQDTQKTDDRLEISSVFGKQASENWYYSFMGNFKTQFSAGYNPDDLSEKNSQFMSPAYLELGPGMLYKNVGTQTDETKLSDFISVNMSPATARMIFVNGKFTENGSSFGVEQGKTSRFEFGASVMASARKTIMENFSIESRLGLYSNYLDKPKNIDIDFQVGAMLKVNKYISTNVTFQALYDDNTYQGFQIRHNIGVGLSYQM